MDVTTNKLEIALKELRLKVVNSDDLLHALVVGGAQDVLFFSTKPSYEDLPSQWSHSFTFSLSAPSGKLLNSALNEIEAAGVVIAPMNKETSYCVVYLNALEWPCVAAATIFEYLTSGRDLSLSKEKEADLNAMTDKHFTGLSWSLLKTLFNSGLVPEDQSRFVNWLMTNNTKYSQNIPTSLPDIHQL